MSKRKRKGVQYASRVEASKPKPNSPLGELEVWTCSDIDAWVRTIPYPAHGDRWGDWRFNAHSLTLEYAPNDCWRSEIDLEQLQTPALLADALFQKSAKNMFTSADLGNLMLAIQDLIHPQANLCSWGRSKQFNATAWLREHLKAGLAHLPKSDANASERD